jgi:hypothetical protein
MAADAGTAAGSSIQTSAPRHQPDSMPGRTVVQLGDRTRDRQAQAGTVLASPRVARGEALARGPSRVALGPVRVYNLVGDGDTTILDVARGWSPR